jgi:hypothetical protein
MPSPGNYTAFGVQIIQGKRGKRGGTRASGLTPVLVLLIILFAES